jgi:hypothetical protein
MYNSDMKIIVSETYTDGRQSKDKNCAIDRLMLQNNFLLLILLANCKLAVSLIYRN